MTYLQAFIKSKKRDQKASNSSKKIFFHKK